jgi:phage-related protein
MELPLKPVHWIGDSLKELRRLPSPVKQEIGFALHRAQEGKKHSSAKPLRGFSGADMLEVVENHAGDTYRAVYTVKFPGAIYVLHVFQKKAKTGIATPKQEIDLIKARLYLAQQHYIKTGGRP